MSLQNSDGLDQVDRSGRNEILNMFLRHRNKWIYGRLDMGYKIKREVKNGSEHFGLSN